MPANAFPGPVAVMFWSTTCRFSCVEQLPHERYSLPKSATWKFFTVSVPPPLC
jgi:hypothetical protein